MLKITHTKPKEKSRKDGGELLTLDPLEPLGPWGPCGQEHITLVGVCCTQLGVVTTAGLDEITYR